tara:strand:+ start:1106 stop:1672 length:567 start_codon:yes stop_codon:yes gene_type:complete
MDRISNKNSAEYVAKKLEFQANNLSAEFEKGAYVVRSYGYYPVFVSVGGQWYENKSRYSSSTAKQMTQCSWKIDRANAIKLSTDELEDLINKGTYKTKELNKIFYSDYQGILDDKPEPKNPALNMAKTFLLLGDLSTNKESVSDQIKYKEKIVFATMKSQIPNWEKPSDWDTLPNAEKLKRLENFQKA